MEHQEPLSTIFILNLEDSAWKRIPVEQAGMAIIPRAKHGQQDCKKAKELDLEKLKKWEPTGW